eukprot:m.1248645 g.1248645  ORF g.1248645 m.1248645 type:complete len:953 (+) comp24698_c1_seq2:158-3016(+)
MASRQAMSIKGKGGLGLDDLTIGTLHRMRITRKSADHLGFTITGGSDYAFGGIYVTSASKSASSTSGVQPGDRILSVDNHGMLSVTRAEADSVMKQLPLEFYILVLRLGNLQWQHLHQKVGGKPRMSVPGPFFNPFCRAINLPLMDGVHSTHGIVMSLQLPAEKHSPLGMRMMCFGPKGKRTGRRDTGCLFISEIYRDGLMYRFPKVSVGSRLLEIDGNSLLSSSRDFVLSSVKECHERNAPVKLVIQTLDRMQWQRLLIAMNKGSIDAGPQNHRASKSSASKRGSQQASPAAKTGTAERGSNIQRKPSFEDRKRLMDAQRSGPPPSSGGSFKPSQQDKQALLEQQRSGSISSRGTPAAPPTPKVVPVSPGRVSAPVTPTPKSSARSKPTMEQKLALMNQQRGGTLERQQQERASSGETVTSVMDNDDSPADVAMLMEDLGGAQHSADEDPFEDSAVEDDLMGTAPEEEDEEEEIPMGFDEFETIDEDENGLPVSAPAPEDKPTERKMQLDEMDVEAYMKLPLKLPKATDMPHGVRPLVRYVNILPTIKTRVPLKQIGNDKTTTFINANYVADYSMHNQKAYVACQGPMPNIRGTADFWRMVWQIKSTAIIMVTGITEGGVEKCARYWPAELYNPTKKLGEQTYDKIKVRVTAGFRKDGFITSCLQVQRGTEPPREIRHYWYDSWPDHGVPDRVEPIISMIKAARAFTGGYDTPWVVHCSAGIGRSGTVIAVDSGMHALLHTGKANVVSIIKNMREGRGGLVQHPEQAKFVHLCLSRYIESHGSVNELAVLEDSIKKAEAAVPEDFGVHRSQTDGMTGEGAHDEIPKWRLEQIRKMKDYEEEGIVFEIEELRISGEDDLANRKEKRAREKKTAAEKGLKAAMELINGNASIKIKAPAFPGQRTDTNRLTYNAGNNRHGSIMIGKLSSRQYAILDGEFHVDAPMEAEEDFGVR